jgi:predicted phosphodiesterase
MKFIHLSDLHFKNEFKQNFQILEMFDFIKRKYNEHYLIITGDITDDGDEQQYNNAFDVLNHFNGRIFICPGNHDFGTRGNQYSKKKAKMFDQKLSIPLGQNDFFFGDNNPVVNKLKKGPVKTVLIAVDTNLETNSTLDFACGEVGKTQIEYLDKFLSEKSVAQYTKIIFMHHHPFIHKNPFMKLKDADEFMKVVEGRTDILLFGHDHKSDIWHNAYGIKYILASDDSPGKDYVREIIIGKHNEIFINNIKINY